MMLGRNPLKSGQCFLLCDSRVMHNYSLVAIPSNRVNVSYTFKPNKSYIAVWLRSQSPQIGSMFLTNRYKQSTK